MKQQTALWFYYICWSKRSSLCYRESLCFLCSAFDELLCFFAPLWRCFMNVPVLVNNLGLLEQLAYWKVSAPFSAAGYNHTMKKHRYDPASVNRRFRSRLCVWSCDLSFIAPVPSSSRPTGSWETSTKWIKWMSRCSRSCRWAAAGSVFGPVCCFTHTVTQLVCFVLDRKHAEMWRRVNAWLKRCRRMFQLWGDD